MVSELDGEQSDLVSLVGFCCAVRNVCWTSKRSVLARDVDDVTTESLINHDSRALAGHKKGTTRQYIVLKVPVIDSRLGQRSTQREASVIDNEINAAEGQYRGRECPLDRDFIGDIHLDSKCDIRTTDFLCKNRGTFDVAVGNHDTCTLTRKQFHSRLPYSARPAGDESYTSRMTFGFR